MFENLNLFQTAHAMARHAGQRQTLVARNMANADTPRYQPSDLAPFSAQMNASSSMRSTRLSHLGSLVNGQSAQIVNVGDANASPGGNSVSVEEELLRAVDVKRQHDRALAIYRHSLTVLRSSLGRK